MTSWKIENKKLVHRYDFENFQTALDFVNKVGELAEQANHHPDISFGWGYVEVSLFTHSEKAITSKDHELAKAIDKLV